MKKRPPLKFRFAYEDTHRRRCVSLEPDGVLCLPVLGFDNFEKAIDVSPLHVHAECLEISLCLRGDLEFELEGKSYPFHPDSVFVARPDEVHCLKRYPRSMSKYWILFRIPKGNFPLLGLPTDEARWLRQELTGLPRSFMDVGHRIRKAFQRIFHIYDSAPANTPSRRCLIRNAALSLFVALVETSKLSGRVLPMARIERIVEEIREDPGKDYPVDELARRAALSQTGLLQRFKRLTGVPPHAFVLACRIERAKRELANTATPIATIADQLGFPSAQHFATSFKRIAGKTPSEWRAQSVIK